MKYAMIWTLCTAILLSAGCEDSSKSSYTPPTGNKETKATPNTVFLFIRTKRIEQVEVGRDHGQ